MERVSSSLLARVAVRVRVTLAFTAVMAVVLSATGLFLYLRLGHGLDATVDQGLRSRADDVTALVRQADSGLSDAGRSPLSEQGESVAQILTPRGRVLDAPDPYRRSPLLSRGELARAARATLVIEHPPSPLNENRVRLLATPVHAQERALIVVVGSSLEPRDEALSNLSSLLLIGGPIALLLASLGGYFAAAVALRPVESMRRRAAEIQAVHPGRRLPVPPSNDEVARLGETLNQMLERLEHAFRRERTFVADASHELRTPLAILKGELELALRDATTVAEYRAAIGSAGEETDRLVQLAEDLLIIARADDQKLPIRPQDVDVTEILAAAQGRFARRAEQRGATLTMAAPPALRVRADPTRLAQSIDNLVDNALLHGGQAIELVAVPANGHVELHVLDDGPGFPPEVLDDAFERFSRGDDARGRPGAGLGLAIVSAIAYAHGGRTGVANRPEGGADAWVALPR